MTRRGTRSRDPRHLQAAKAAREPWLLAVSPSLGRQYSPRQIMAIYAQRMQIEEAFRDLKSHRYGAAFEDSLTRKPKRLSVLLLLHALATFAAWMAGNIAQHAALAPRLLPNSSKRRCDSILRLGRQPWLAVGCPPSRPSRIGLLHCFASPAPKREKVGKPQPEGRPTYNLCGSPAPPGAGLCAQPARH
jgi:hypothetical protein